MNDEDFARQVFVHALAGEPDAVPRLDDVAARARRASRTRQGVYAAGTVALAGAVTAGVVSAPALIPRSPGTPPAGQPSTSGESPASGKPTTQPSAKPSGVACAQPPAINWTSVASAHLPTGMTLTPMHDPTCVQLSIDSGTAETIEALFTLSHPSGTLQINVNTGVLGAKAATSTQQPNVSPSGTPAGLTAKLDAIKRSGGQLPSPSGLETPGTAGAKVAQLPTCSPAGAGETVCVSEVSKGGFRALDVQLFRTASPQVVVDVVASTPKPMSANASPQLPLDAAQLTALAQDIARRF